MITTILHNHIPAFPFTLNLQVKTLTRHPIIIILVMISQTTNSSLQFLFRKMAIDTIPFSMIRIIRFATSPTVHLVDETKMPYEKWKTDGINKSKSQIITLNKETNPNTQLMMSRLLTSAPFSRFPHHIYQVVSDLISLVIFCPLMAFSSSALYQIPYAYCICVQCAMCIFAYLQVEMGEIIWLVFFYWCNLLPR